MQSIPSSDTISQLSDNCAICLLPLSLDTALLTLSCNHKFHFQCLASNIQAQNKVCPLYRTAIDASIVGLLTTSNQVKTNDANVSTLSNTIIPSIEDPIDEDALRILSERLVIARESAGTSSTDDNNLPLIFGSMAGEKIALLKETLIYIVEQLNELDRLAIVSFNTTALNVSHGLKRMNQPNQQILKNTIADSIASRGGTYIGSGLQCGIDLLVSHRTRNPLGALLLLTDSQDNQQHDYTQLMRTLPETVQCHTFGYGPDHTATLLAELAQQGHEASFTYIRAIGTAFGMVLGGLFTCVPQQIRVDLEFTGDYKITNFHSKYKYEPEQLSSTKLSICIQNLNADERRNLIFQLHVPKLHDEQTVDITNQQRISQDESFENDCIGHVAISYVDPNTTRSITTNPIPFQLIRTPNPSADLLQINPTLDCQRNRIETALALEQAMEEDDFQLSRTIFKTQVEKIKASISSNHPFCQELIKDLEHSYASERDYRSSHHNNYMCHHTERGTYIPEYNVSSDRYAIGHQRQLAARIRRKYLS
ncbi:hypothetical protein I4U23_004349 [Adineta vaga]|nr:hypothetical protein I4U23_004349 [Adineta vaga]